MWIGIWHVLHKRVRTSWEVAHSQEGQPTSWEVAPPYPLKTYMWRVVGVLGEVAAYSHTLGCLFHTVVRPPCPLGVPSSIGMVTHLVINWSFLPLHKLVRVLGRIVVVSLYHSWIGIKKALEANLVWIHVWLLIVMCKFMRWHCFISFVYANLLKLAFVGVLLLMKDWIINLVWFLIPIDYLFWIF
jgi:hypothetical protein